MSKKILLITGRYPLPPIGGEKVRILKIAEFFALSGIKVDIVSLIEQPIKEAWPYGRAFFFAQSKLLKIWGTLVALVAGKPLQVGYFNNLAGRRKCQQLLKENDYDVVLCHLVRMLPYCVEAKIPIILEMTDAISLNYERLQTPKSLLELMYKIEQRRLPQYEDMCIDKTNHTVLVSDTDKLFLMQRLTGRSADKVHVIPNGVDRCKKPVSKRPSGKRIAFLGNMRSKQNEDAAEFFIQAVFPQFLAQHPTAEFIIIGADPSPRLKNIVAKNPRVSLTGKVKNPRGFLKTCFVSVAPIRYGAGMQNKVLESMACGVPVICSQVAFSGFEKILSKMDVFLADIDNVDTFSLALDELLVDDKKWIYFSKRGYEICQKLFSWESRLRPYLKIIDSMLDSPVNVKQT